MKTFQKVNLKKKYVSELVRALIKAKINAVIWDTGNGICDIHN